MDGEWLKIFAGLDMGVMAAIGVIAFFLERSQRVPDSITIFIPLTLGGIWGFSEAMSTGYGTFAHIFKGVLLNGAGAAAIARALNVALAKWWDNPPPVPAKP